MHFPTEKNAFSRFLSEKCSENKVRNATAGDFSSRRGRVLRRGHPAPLLLQLAHRRVLLGAAEGGVAPCHRGCPIRNERRRRSATCGGLLHRSIGQTLEGSFAAVSKPNFATKYAFESSRRDLHSALLCTALQSQLLSKKCLFESFSLHSEKFSIKNEKISKIALAFFEIPIV